MSENYRNSLGAVFRNRGQSILSRRTTLYSTQLLRSIDEIEDGLPVIAKACQQTNEPSITFFELGVAENQLPKGPFLIETAQKWLTLESKNGREFKFPLKTILPKVQLTRKVPLKHLPRDVEVDRRRRQYAKINLMDELQKADLSNEELFPTEEQYYILSENAFKHFLPISFFDDSNFDANSPEAWLKLGEVEDGTRYPLPAKAYLPVNQSLMEYQWQNAAVYSYNDKTAQWKVTVVSDEHVYDVPKIQIMFLSENPYTFVERIKYAVKKRNKAETIIMLETIIDCVMLQDLTENRIYPNALVDKLMNNVKTDPEFNQQLRTEIYIVFEHLMACYEFEKFVKLLPKEFPKFNSEIIRESLPKAFNSELGKNERKALKALKLNIPQRRKKLLTYTFYYTKGGIDAMCHVAHECHYIETLAIFLCSFSKPLPLTDFLQSQDQNSTNVANFLKNFWPTKIAGGILAVFRVLGKGWLDLNLDIWSVYMMCKISRFILQVKFRMQESIQVLLEKSIENFTSFLTEPCLQFLNLTANYKWTNDYIESEFPFNKPAFSLTISVTEDREIAYSTAPEEFAPAMRDIFKESLEKTSGIRCIDAETMSNLRFAPNLYILTVELIEDLYIKCDDLLQRCYKSAVIPLKAYARKFERFIDFYLLNVQKYMVQYREAKKPSMQIKADIIEHKRNKEELRQILPPSINIGPFYILVDPMKQYMIKKRIEIVRKIFDYYVDRMYDTNEQLLERCSEVYNKLHERPQSIEHLYDIRDFALTVPDIVEQIRGDIQIMWLEYDMLDSFFYNLPDHQFAMKWEAYAWPKNILDRLRTLRDEQKVDIEEFKRLHASECTAFEERLESLNDEIQNFSLQFNPEKVTETAVEVKKTWKIISDLKRIGETLQYRQELFELEPLTLEFLENIIGGFLPYKNLWYACQDFVKLVDATIGNPIVNIELNEVWENMEHIRESLNESLTVFSDKPEIQNVAHHFLKQMDEFLPKYNAIKDLKNENWLYLHWQEFANRSGIDIKFSNAMNFQYCIRKGILDHLDLVHEISVKADNEADAILKQLEEEERRKEEERQAILMRKSMRKCRIDIL